MAFNNMGELIDHMKAHREIYGLRGWIFSIMTDTEEAVHGRWEEFCKVPLSRECVLNLGSSLCYTVAHILEQTWDDKLYNDTRTQGHAALQLLARLAIENGIVIHPNEIDNPLTPSEALAEAEIARIIIDRYQSI